ncbi:hypothetical protein HMPREF9446_02916 [Bacteroides fluxus YIT 12057]|uniref:Uncharacterized protein n=1 Tax=Bacteroides fluxus YIT 12057 TaxID=763034 RepID=F3PVY6_9BACE|nr:hypothetical protein HMPREF9446_02916 [Bacteroides fluxus YIT 12057]
MPTKTSNFMYIQQVLYQQVELRSADTPFMVVEVVAQDGTHLPDPAFHGIAVPHHHLGVERAANDAHIGSDGSAYIVAGTELYLFVGQDDSDFGMVGTHHTQGIGPTSFRRQDVTRSFFLFF